MKPIAAGWRRFGNEDGYALTLSLVALPFLLGVAAFAIDAARITNLHTDLQDAADALALAGARELDGRNDAITRAENAMRQLASNTAWFGGGGDGFSFGGRTDIRFSADETNNVTVQFLGAIPANDDDAIDDTACQSVSAQIANANCQAAGTTLERRSNNARYVRVIVNAQNVRTIFPIPGTGRDDVAVSAEAVATYTAAACDVTPIFICNPYETSAGSPLANGMSFNENFEAGNMYGRQIKLQYDASNPPGPGNFGFLRTNGSGANVLAEALATGSPGVCYAQSGLDTEPGSTVGPVTVSLNSRFGIYTNGQGGFPNNNPAYAPDVNTRRGQASGKKNGNGGGNSGPDCNNYVQADNTEFYNALPLPEGESTVTVGGGSISGSGDWDIETYWDISHGGHTDPVPVEDYTPTTSVPSDLTPTTYPGANGAPAGTTPSRFDVYNYEIANDIVSDAAPNGETGAPQCQASSITPTAGRRIIFSAVVNCIEHADELNGAATNIPAEAYARMFLTKPAIADGNNRFISMEIVDVSGRGGRGTVEDLLREEAELVR